MNPNADEPTDAVVVDAGYRDPASLDMLRRIQARELGMCIYLWPSEPERVGIVAHCPNCGNVAHRMYSAQKRRYEFACVERTCYERWAIVKGTEVRL